MIGLSAWMEAGKETGSNGVAHEHETGKEGWGRVEDEKWTRLKMTTVIEKCEIAHRQSSIDSR